MVNQKVIEGKIQTKTKDSIKIEGLWIKFFDTKYIDCLEAGDEVGVQYKELTKDGKLYRNGVSTVKFEGKVKAIDCDIDKVVKNFDTTQQNTIMMSAISIYCKQLEVYHDFKAIQTLGEITKEVLNAYSLIK